MADLVVLVPSRGRPGNIRRFIGACKRTCTADTLVVFGFDDDDPCKVDNILAADGAVFSTGSRAGLAKWTNRLAVPYVFLGDTPFVASLGDDMVPVTEGWDAKLMAACGKTGMAYPDDKRRDDIPEAIVMTADIPRALGWMCAPGLDHWFIDAVWRDIGQAAGCLTYVPDVVVEHRHPNVPGGDPPDATYREAAEGFGRDMAAYQKWRLKGMREDIAKVRALCTAG